MERKSEADPVSSKLVNIEQQPSNILPFPFSKGSDRILDRLSYGVKKGFLLGLGVGAVATGLTSALGRISPYELLKQDPEVLPAVVFGAVCMAAGHAVIEVLK